MTSLHTSDSLLNGFSWNPQKQETLDENYTHGAISNKEAVQSLWEVQKNLQQKRWFQASSQGLSSKRKENWLGPKEVHSDKEPRRGENSRRILYPRLVIVAYYLPLAI